MPLYGQGGWPCPGQLRHAGWHASASRLPLPRAPSACRPHRAGQTCPEACISEGGPCVGKAVALAQGTFGMPARPAWARQLPLPRAPSACRPDPLGQGGYPCPGQLRHAGFQGSALSTESCFFCEKSRHLETKLPKRGQISSLDDSFWSFYRSNRSSRRSSKQSSKRFRSRGLRIEEPKNGHHLPGNPGRVESSLPNRVFFVRKADIWRQNCQNEVKFRLSTIVFGVFTDQIDRRGDRRSNRRRDLGPGA